jgi:hypothetical protein
VGEEALQEPGRGLGIPLGIDLQMNVSCGAIHGDEGTLEASIDSAARLLAIHARQRWIAVCPTPISAANSATDFLLPWM